MSGKGGDQDAGNRGTGSQINPYYAFGAGNFNKYCNLENAPTTVIFQLPTRLNGPRGRDLWSNPSNPYQFDQAWNRRAENWCKEAALEQENRKLGAQKMQGLDSSRSNSTRSSGGSSSTRRSARSSR